MRNPIRRSKKIGKTQGGRVRDGKPSEKWSRLFTRTLWEKLSEETDQSGYVVLSENPSKNYYHPVNEEEIRFVLKKLRYWDREYLRAVVLPRIRKRDAKKGVQAWRRDQCIILNPFPKSRRIFWSKRNPQQVAISHYKPWGATWVYENDCWYQDWSEHQVKRYYLYHLLLHELGHINEPRMHKSKRREDFAENYALEWARKLKVII